MSTIDGMSMQPQYSTLIPKSWLPSSYTLISICVGFPLLAVLLNALKQLLLPVDPTLPPLVFHWIPWFGSAAQYGDDPLNFLFRCREKYGDVFTFILLGRRVTVALGPKGNNFVLGGKLSQVSAKEAYESVTTPVFGKDVAYDVPNHVFMEQKRFIKVGLTPENFKLYVDMIEKEVEGYLQTEPGFATYRDGDTTRWGRFNPYKTMAQITILTAARTLQGDEIRSGMDKTFAETYADLDGGFTPLNFMFPNLPLPSYWRRDRAHMKMSNFYVNIIRKRREEGCSVSGHDMIEALSNQTYKDGRPLTDSEVAHIMIALLMAGQHTSSATTSWALLNISSRPDIQQALYDEQVKHFGQADGSLGKLTYEEMKNLPVLDAVIRETLRRHPPIHSIMRKVIAPIDVPPTLAAPSKDAAYHIPKGHYVLASPAFSQVDTRIWKDATNWEPSRWYDADGIAASEYAKYTEEKGEKIDYGYGLVSKGTESQYLPFGAGRHRCIGEQFAYVQVGTIIASIIRRMELQVERRVPDHNYHTMVVLPKEPCGIKYRRRS